MGKAKSTTKRWMVFTDSHFPLHDRKAFSCFLQAIAKVKPYGVLCAGDVAEQEAFSHWQWRRRKKPPLEYQLPVIDKEVAEVNKYLDELQVVLDKNKIKNRVMIEGNHELWIKYFVEEYPYLADKYSFDKLYHLTERGYKIIPNSEMFKLGKLNVYHGNLYGGDNHTKNHLLKMGVNVMYGDKHCIQQWSVSHVDGEKSAWCIGCLKSLKPEHNEFMMGRPHNWGHAFAIVDVFDGGLFSVDVHRIINGKCSLWGDIIDGKA